MVAAYDPEERVLDAKSLGISLSYELLKGTPMGSPISSLVSELVLQELENVAFDHYEPAFWRRYVDETFAIIERSRLADVQDLPNGIFPDIQFTREEEHAEQLPFS
ncbi:hypothetical protein SprV_0401694600 [Sparganum proliferum]